MLVKREARHASPRTYGCCGRGSRTIETSVSAALPNFTLFVRSNIALESNDESRSFGLGPSRDDTIGISIVGG